MSSSHLDPSTDRSAAETFPRLLGDVGGTNARLALQWTPHGEPDQVRFLPTAEFDGPLTAIEHYLAQVASDTGRTVPEVQPRWACLGLACPIKGDRVSMTNVAWTFSISQLQSALGLSRLVCLNDFTALAWSLPALQVADLRQVGGGLAVPGRARALLGAGTGLGVSGLLPAAAAPDQTPNGWVPIVGEGGHVTLAARDALEARVIEALQLRWDHVSAERVLSGFGLEALYEVLAGFHRQTPGADAIADRLAAPEIAARAQQGSCPVSAQTIDLFCAFLGTVAGDLALTLGALGGVYIGGGIVPKLGDHFVRSRFRERFEDKGRYREYLHPVPVYVIHDGLAALRGVATALDACEAQSSS